MHDRSQFRHARGFAAVLLREMADVLGHRERAILADPQAHARRWPYSSDCTEWCVPDRPDLGACVIRRDRTIVG